jgi:hypothetical protein
MSMSLPDGRRRLAAPLAAITLVSACVALSASVAAARAEGPLDAYIPKSGVLAGHVVELRVAQEDQVISRQFQLAVQNNMEWFKHYVTANKAGEPLPYNSHMGVTKAQYDQLLRMRAEIVEKAPITLTLRRAADGGIALVSSDPAAEALKGTTIPADEKAVDTPVGPLGIVTPIHQKDPNAPFGVWDGVEWARVASDGSDQPSAKIAFGKRSPSGEGLFYYQVAPTKDRPEQSLVVTYKLD